MGESVRRPLAHLEGHQTASERPGLTIDLWDADESGIPSPLASAPADLGPSGLVSSSPHGRLVAHQRPWSVVMLDRQDQRLVGWIQSSRQLPQLERARPLHLLLSVWCSDRNLQVIHAGLVARNGHGVLLAGLSGAGKSTSALACACAGFDFLGDDCVALGPAADGGFVGYSLYSSTALESSQLARFRPLPRPATDEAGPNEKSLAFLGDVGPLRCRRQVPIRVLALPRIVTTTHLRIRPASKAEALRGLAPSSLVKRAVPARLYLSRLAKLVEDVPSYWLELGPDLRDIPRRVERLLAAASPREADTD